MLFHCHRRRCRNRVTTRTRALGSRSRCGFGMSPLLLLLLLLLSVCCVWRGGTCDHMWREDIVECHAAVVTFSSPCLLPLVRAINTGGRGRCGVICRGGGGDGRRGRALGSTAFTAHWLGERALVGWRGGEGEVLTSVTAKYSSTFSGADKKGMAN